MEPERDTARVNGYLFRIRQLIRSSNPHVLHFDCTVGDLRPWFWPITDEGHRVTPEDLASYRASGFRRPCCFCAVPRLDGVSVGYTESTVVIATDGEHSGKFVLTCAGNKCVYQLPIDNAYVSPGLPLKRYTRLQPAMPANRDRRTGASNSRRHGLTNIASGIRRSAPLAVEDSPYSKIIRLNSVVFPGLPENEFQALFTKCRRCRWIMTHRAFRYHACPAAVPDIIDLTMNGSSDGE